MNHPWPIGTLCVLKDLDEDRTSLNGQPRVIASKLRETTYSHHYYYQVRNPHSRGMESYYTKNLEPI